MTKVQPRNQHQRHHPFIRPPTISGQSTASPKPTHANLTNILSELRGFEDIIAAEPALVFLSVQSPQAAQLIAMMPGCRDIVRLVGMQDAKKQLFQLVMRGLLQRLLPPGVLPHALQNIVILGPPGVGKTTLMRAFASVCAAGGITRRAHVTFAGRAEMVGQYLGTSALATKKVVEDALGGMLVIDEVYAFGSADNRDFFAKEAVDELNRLMEIHKGDLLVVVAGYPDDVRTCFFAINKGLERRFLLWMTLPPYTADQLADIFQQICATRGWTVDARASERLMQHTSQLTHYASDVVALCTHLDMAAAQRLWANATPVRLPEAAAAEKAVVPGPVMLRIFPAYMAKAEADLSRQQKTLHDAELASGDHYRFGSVSPQSLGMQVTVEDVDTALVRLLLDRTNAAEGRAPPSGMYY